MTDASDSDRIDGMIARMAEIEAMAGQEMSRREIAALQAEHAHLALVIANAESRRLRIKAIQMEHKQRVLDAYYRQERDDLRAMRERKAAVEYAGRKRL